MVVAVRTLFVAVAVLAVLAGAGPASAAGCAGAHAAPQKGSLPKVRKAALCLLNRERAQAGLGRIRDDRRLRKAATRHSRDMVRRGYFDHTAPSGETMTSRATRAGYLKARAASWYLAENIARGPGEWPTAANIVKMWMDSPPHRANILSAQARDAGLGLALGHPQGGPGATYTLNVGRVG